MKKETRFSVISAIGKTCKDCGLGESHVNVLVWDSIEEVARCRTCQGRKTAKPRKKSRSVGSLRPTTYAY